MTTVEKLEAVLGRIRIREAPKVRRAQEILRERLNYSPEQIKEMKSKKVV